jgi:hypothetical protein
MSLRHPNVLPLLGVVADETHLAMISVWMGNGNVREFLKVDTNADRLELVRFLFRILTARY